ncbi:MAG: hypothetical protein B7733_19650 [Myxococcales bacterium FL481]|nr:MAG: hypothetical protein B7733_19650 [Myxococcales bacterium FL481]
MADLLDILRTYLLVTRPLTTVMLALFALGLVAWRVSALPPGLGPGPIARRRRVERILTAIVLLGGLAHAIHQASLFDDAYISLRYARNLVEGHGLVFNVGQRVEGYTNFLWTVLLAGANWVTGVELPLLALIGSLTAFAVTILTAARLGRRLSPSPAGTFHLPLAAALLATQAVFVEYGTTGMETGFVAMLTILGAGAFCFATDRKGMRWAGVCFALATLTRPDHALYYAAAVMVGALPWLATIARRPPAFVASLRSEDFARVLHLAAPALLVLLHLGWRRIYYGEWLPNTYYAKAADQVYWQQGLRYLTAFLAAPHTWVLLVVIAWGYSRATTLPARRFFQLTLLTAVLVTAYLVKVGGGYMFGRFFVPLVPLVVVAAEHSVYASLHRAGHNGPRRLKHAALFGLLASTAVSAQLFPVMQYRWNMNEQRSYYRVRSWFPVEVEHWAYDHGQQLGELYDAGFRPKIACSGIGMISYYGRHELFDTLGLTEKAVARRRLSRRGIPGHEKMATLEQILEGEVQFLLGWGIVGGHDRLKKVCLTPPTCKPKWQLLYYDRDDMALLREIAPDAKPPKTERHIDRYIRRLARRKQPLDDRAHARVMAKLAFLDDFYFQHNDDDARRQRFVRAYEQALPAYPHSWDGPVATKP